MTACTVTCRECPTDTGVPRVWHWLCTECCIACAEEHHRTTGHFAYVNFPQEEPEVVQVPPSCQVAAMIRRRR